MAYPFIIKDGVRYPGGYSFPTIVAATNLYAQVANVASAASATPLGEGTFRISVEINVTVIVVGCIVEVTYTDHNAVAQTDLIPIIKESTGTLTAGAFTTVDRWTGSYMIRATSATAIVVKTISYVSGTYDLSTVIERVA
jgi:hypothetical protein